MRLNLSRIHYPVTALGPGNRIGIWFQGCSIKCAGCISQDTWEFGRNDATISNVIEVIRSEWSALADGVTISGGEPFDQAMALEALLIELRKIIKGDILVYTGYPLASISGQLQQMSGLIDALITEPFELNAPQTLPLRGSDNQALHLLTSLAKQRYLNADKPIADGDKRLDVVFDDEDTVWIAGIPRRGDLNELLAFLRSIGFKAQTTEDLRGAV